MNNIVDLLLKIDANEVKMPTGEHEMFCKKLGEKLNFEIKAIDAEVVSEISEQCIDMTGGEFREIDTYKLKVKTIVEGCDLFRNKELQAHFNVLNSDELVKKLLLSGEMDALQSAINGLNEVQKEDKIEEIKN